MFLQKYKYFTISMEKKELLSGEDRERKGEFAGRRNGRERKPPKEGTRRKRPAGKRLKTSER